MRSTNGKSWGWKLWLRIAIGGAFGVAVSGIFASSANRAIAQITPDGTLPNNSRVITQDNIRIIEGGTRTGGNLFHSFQEFSIPTGGEALFNNAGDIQNIISRVTGGSVSNIDGLIRALGNANLFLLNPNGIIFGKNASLNIGGSFVATTANAVQFGNQGFFRASNPNTPPLLTVNPSAFLFNQIAAAPIQNNSQAPAGFSPSGFESSGLRVPDGRSLLLVGGNVSMDGGRLNAFGGRVELGGLTAQGTVGLSVDGNNLSLNVPENIARADVSLINEAKVDVTAENGGSIAINAGNIQVLGKSSLLAGISPDLGSASSQAGDLTLNATGTIKGGQGSRILNIVDSNSIGSAGNINLTADSLILTDGTQLTASVFGKGNAGNISIQAREISFDGIDSNGFSSGAFSAVEAGAQGKGGNINVRTGSLSVTNGAQIIAATFGQGNAGNVTIDARDSISLHGVSQDGSFPSGVFSSIEDPKGVGKGGNISLTAGSLSLTNGARLSASTRGRGNTGSITIQARNNILLDGVGGNGFFSGVLNEVLTGAVGNGGNINVTTGSLLAKNGARLTAQTSGVGNAGDVKINAQDSISLDGRNTGIFSNVRNRGNGGNVTVSTGTLSVTNRAQLSATTFFKGNAGNVSIEARNGISFDGVGTGAFSRVGERGEGSAGNVNITTTGSLFVTNNAQLAADTLGRGNAGNVTINAQDTISFDGVNSAAASAVGPRGVGKGGNVTITAGSVSVTNGARLVASTQGQGDAGSITINGRDTVSFDGVSPDGQRSSDAFTAVLRGAVGNAGDITINTGSLSVTNGARLVTIAEGQGNAGSVKIDARDAVFFGGVGGNGRSSSIFSDLAPGVVGKSGNITITTGSLSATDGAFLTVSTSGQGDAGKVLINARDTVSFKNNARVASVVQEGAVGNAGGITITTDSLSVTNGAFLSTTTIGRGDAGSVKIDAGDRVFLSGNETGIFSRVRPEAIGKGGNVTINTGSLSVTDQAQVSVSNIGRGEAGEIEVTASSISLDNKGTIQATTASGNGGNINLNVRDLLLLRRGSGISTTAGTAGAGGDGGNITINDLPNYTGFIVAIPSENSDITANAYTGKGGNLRINTQGIFGTQFRPQLTPESDITASSELGVAGIVEINTPDIDPSQGLVELPINLIDASQQIATGCNPGGKQRRGSFTATGRGGTRHGPTEPLIGDAVLVPWVTLPLEANEQHRRMTDIGARERGNTKAHSVNPPTEIVEASGWVVDAHGNVALVATAPTPNPHSPWLPPTSCPVP